MFVYKKTQTFYFSRLCAFNNDDFEHRRAMMEQNEWPAFSSAMATSPCRFVPHHQVREFPHFNPHGCSPALQVQPSVDAVIFAEIQDFILKFSSFVFDNRQNCAILKSSYKIQQRWKSPYTLDDIWKPLS
jgi:hypothetical protein